MIGRPLEDRLRDWYRDDVGTEPAPASLRSAVSAIPETVRPRSGLADTLASPRVRLLLVVALLGALLATAIGVGALLRPADPPVVHLTRFVGAECMPSEDEALPTDRPMVFEDRNASIGFVGDADAPAGKTVILFADGRLVTQPNGRTSDQIAAGDAGSTVRRLSPRGIELLLAGIDRTRLAVPGCHYDLQGRGSLRLLDVRFPGRPVASTHWGTYSGIDDPLSEEDLAALAALQARIERPQEWLPSEAWLDAEDRTLAVERWRIVVRLIPATAAMTHGAPERIELPAIEDLELQAGQDPRTYGTRLGEEPDGVVVWCDVANAETANTLQRHLNRTGAPIANFSFWFADGADRVMVSVAPLVDASSGCTPLQLGIEGPTPPPGNP